MPQIRLVLLLAASAAALKLPSRAAVARELRQASAAAAIASLLVAPLRAVWNGRELRFVIRHVESAAPRPGAGVPHSQSGAVVIKFPVRYQPTDLVG